MSNFNLKKKRTLRGMLFPAAILLLLAASPLHAAQADIAISPPVTPKDTARYRMVATTTSGVGIASQRILTLDARGLPARGTPNKAWHMIPEAMRMGRYLPLARPARFFGEKEYLDEYEPDGWTTKIYWGSAKETPKGQPIVIAPEDDGKRSQLYDAQSGKTSLSLRREPAKGWGWGQWSNEDLQVRFSPDSSLRGNHLVHGNFLPHIKFAVSQHDFLEPLRVQTGDGNLHAPIPVTWKPVPRAIGYFVYAVADDELKKEYVIWTSSRRATHGMQSCEHSDRVRTLADAGVLLKPDVLSCNIPMGIFAGYENVMIMVYAWGDDYRASYPPRPTNPPKGWKPDWRVSGLFFARWSGIPGTEKLRPVP